jgi:hypothetical protein
MTYTNDHLRRAALDLLRDDPSYADDARAGAHVGNTVVGSILALTYGSPRWATEDAVRHALTELDAEGGDA